MIVEILNLDQNNELFKETHYLFQMNIARFSVKPDTSTDNFIEWLENKQELFDNKSMALTDLIDILIEKWRKGNLPKNIAALHNMDIGDGAWHRGKILIKDS